MGVINETVTSVLAEKKYAQTNPACSTLEAYNKMLFLISMDITEDVVKLVAQKLSRSLLSGGT